METYTSLNVSIMQIYCIKFSNKKCFKINLENLERKSNFNTAFEILFIRKKTVLFIFVFKNIILKFYDNDSKYHI